MRRKGEVLCNEKARFCYLTSLATFRYIADSTCHTYYCRHQFLGISALGGKTIAGCRPGGPVLQKEPPDGGVSGGVGRFKWWPSDARDSAQAAAAIRYIYILRGLRRFLLCSGTDIIFEFGPNLKSTNQRPKDVHKSAPPFTRVAGGVDLDFASTAVLRIEQFSGLTKWESDQKAKARINVLLGEVGGDDGGKDKRLESVRTRREG